MKDFKINIILKVFVVCLFLAIGFLCYQIYNGRIQDVSLNYKENSNIDYSVVLKKNNFFEDKVLTKSNLINDNKILIAQLIDTINMNFTYNLDYDHNVSGNYSYYVKAIATAYKENDKVKNYWSKEVNLTDEKKVTLNDSKHLNIKSDASLKYDYYNNLLNEFKRDFNLAIDAELKVILVVKGTTKSDTLGKELPVYYEAKMDLPLTEKAIEVNINSNTNKIDKVLSNTVTSTNIIYYIAFVSIFICLIVVISQIILIIIDFKKYKKDNFYQVTLKNIIDGYDNIIVNIKELPDFKKYNLIEIDSFNELLDAQSELRMPVHYYNEESGSTFFIINNDVIWKYRLVNDKFVEKKEKKERKAKVKNEKKK